MNNQSTPFLYHLIGCASGLSGVRLSCGQGPLVIQRSHLLQQIKDLGIELHWDAMIEPQTEIADREHLFQLYEKLAKAVSRAISSKHRLSVIGGDHACAIGTWSGVYDAVHTRGDLGLIWIDAHMDSHTPQTSETGRIHGMPLAVLLGEGDARLTSLLQNSPKLKPQNVCLIGVRSFESGEAALLKKLNVRIYFMDEVKERGFAVVLQEAIAQVRQSTVGYGISLDLDSIDPHDAPGVDVPEPDGILADELCAGLKAHVADPRLIATEIVEFDPALDHNHQTEKLLIKILSLFAEAKMHLPA